MPTEKEIYKELARLENAPDVATLLNTKIGKNQINILHYAASIGDITTISKLAKIGFPFNILDDTGQNALHYLLDDISDAETIIEIAKILLEHGTAINQQDINADTPFHTACSMVAQPEVITFLIANGANLALKNEEKDTGLDIIMCGIKNNDGSLQEDELESLKIILQNPTSNVTEDHLNIIDNFQQNAEATSLPLLNEITKIIRQKLGLPETEESQTKSTQSTENLLSLSYNPVRNRSLIINLIKKGEDVNVQDNQGRTPLEIMAEFFIANKETYIYNKIDFDVMKLIILNNNFIAKKEYLPLLKELKSCNTTCPQTLDSLVTIMENLLKPKTTSGKRKSDFNESSSSKKLETGEGNQQTQL